MIVSKISIINWQLPGVYSIPNFNDKVECNLFLYSSNHYYLELSEFITSDIIESLVISYGSYYLKLNELILLDKVHNFRMSLTINHKTLTMKHSFKWLTDKQFVINSRDIDTEPEFIVSKSDASTIKLERLNYNCSHNHEFLMNFGIYRNTSGLSLNIQANKKYIYKYQEFILSSGIWNRKGNELELIDSTLKHSFYVLISEGALFSKLLPGEYKGCKLDFDNRSGFHFYLKVSNR